MGGDANHLLGDDFPSRALGSLDLLNVICFGLGFGGKSSPFNTPPFGRLENSLFFSKHQTRKSKGDCVCMCVFFTCLLTG